MEKQLERYLDELVALIKDAGAFALEELPIFLQEYLFYYAWYHAFWMMLWLGVFLALFFTAFSYWREYSRKKKEDYPSEHELGNIRVVIACCSAVSVFILAAVVDQGLSLLKATIAPRVYLIENLTKLL